MLIVSVVLDVLVIILVILSDTTVNHSQLLKTAQFALSVTKVTMASKYFV